MRFNKFMILIISLIVLMLSVTTVCATDINQTGNTQIIPNNDVSVQEVQQKDNDILDDNKINYEKNFVNKMDVNEDKEYSESILNEYSNDNTISSNNQINLPVIYLNSDYFVNHNNQLSFDHKRIMLWGDFENMGNIEITADTGLVFYTESNPMVNTTFTVTGTNFHLGNFKINNTGSDYNENAILIFNSSDALVSNANIIYNKSAGEVHGINVYNSNNVSVENSVINITGVPQYMGWTDEYPWQGGVKVTGINYVNSSDSYVKDNSVYVQNNTSPFDGYYTTMEGITVKDHSHRITLTNNQVNVTGGRNNYGTTVSDGSTNITFDNNKFNITGQRYVCGLQYDNSQNCTAINNNISLFSEVDNNVPLSNNEETISYGIILTAWSNGGTINSTVFNNTINSTSHVGYGMEIYDATYSNITENKIILNGDKVIGIGSYRGHNTNITDNILHISGTDDATNNIVEMITPDNQGIMINSTNSNNINDNTICVHNTGSTNDIYAIKSTSTLNELNNNKVCVCNSQGQKTLSDSISATATTSSGNQLYNCPECNGNCISQSNTNVLSNAKNKKDLKSDSKTIVITADNFSNYVSDAKLNDNVNDGDTLDFQGIFYGARFALNINKAVNIISSTNDAFIWLDTENTDFFGKDVGGSFTVSRNGSGTNITGIFFNNTQLFIKNADNITLNNITVNNEDLQLGSGVGVTSIRDNSSNIKVLNSYFRTKDNLGHSTLVCAWANNVLIENCTIEAEGTVGNLFYATTYNVEGVENIQPYANNNITFRNNHIDGLKAEVAPICYAISLEGKGHVIENNTVEYNGACLIQQWGIGNVSDITFKDNNVPYGRVYVRFNGTNIVSGNNIYNATIANANVTNNNINLLNLYDNVNLSNNNLGMIKSTIAISNISLTKNVIDTLTIVSNSRNFYVANNTIYSSQDYAVNINNNAENITLENNYICSKDKNATEAINNQTSYVSNNNIGIIIYNFTDDDILPFNYKTETGKLYYEESMWGNNYYFDAEDNSVAYFNLNKSGNFVYYNPPSIMIINASNIDYISPQPPVNKGIFSFERTSFLINSYLPNTYSNIIDSLDWYTCNVDVLLNIVNSTFKESSSVGTQSEIKFFNNSFIDDVKNDTNTVINTSISIDVEKIVQPNSKVDLQFLVNADNTTVNNGKLILFDDETKYGEFDVENGMANCNLSFDKLKQYRFMAYYVGDENYNNSNVKFNFTVKYLDTLVNIDPVIINTNNLTTFTVNVTNELGEKINGGKVFIKVNGKVLKDENGKVIYAKVVNGQAVVKSLLTNLKNNDELTILAKYVGTGKYKSAENTTKVNITITPTITTEDITTTVGSTIALTATVTDGSNVINKAKVVFKINGKTVKDVNGKIIYAKLVNNTVTFEYKLPETYNANNYTITATLISQDYDRITDTKTLIIA